MGTSGWHHTEEYKEYMRQLFKGRKMSPESRAKMSVSQRGNKSHLGHKLTDEQRVRVAEGTRKAMANKEIRQRLSEKHNGLKQSSETIAKRVLKVIGRKNSDEVKARMSKSKKRDWNNTEYREKCVKALIRAIHIRPTQPEIMLGELINKVYPNAYEYSGDNYEHVIGGFCPDYKNRLRKPRILMLGMNQALDNGVDI